MSCRLDAPGSTPRRCRGGRHSPAAPPARERVTRTAIRSMASEPAPPRSTAARPSEPSATCSSNVNTRPSGPSVRLAAKVTGTSRTSASTLPPTVQVPSPPSRSNVERHAGQHEPVGDRHRSGGRDLDRDGGGRRLRRPSPAPARHARRRGRPPGRRRRTAATTRPRTRHRAVNAPVCGVAETARRSTVTSGISLGSAVEPTRPSSSVVSVRLDPSPSSVVSDQVGCSSNAMDTSNVIGPCVVVPLSVPSSCRSPGSPWSRSSIVTLSRAEAEHGPRGSGGRRQGQLRVGRADVGAFDHQLDGEVDGAEDVGHAADADRAGDRRVDDGLAQRRPRRRGPGRAARTRAGRR